MFVAIDDRPAGIIAVADPIKATMPAALESLRRAGIRIAVLTGDNRATAQALAAKLSITDIEAEVLPEQKNAIVRRLRAGTIAQSRHDAQYPPEPGSRLRLQLSRDTAGRRRSLPRIRTVAQPHHRCGGDESEFCVRNRQRISTAEVAHLTVAGALQLLHNEHVDSAILAMPRKREAPAPQPALSYELAAADAYGPVDPAGSSRPSSPLTTA